MLFRSVSQSRYPSKISAPAPPSKVSSPEPPYISSSPPFPYKESFPSPPDRVFLLLSPINVSALLLPNTFSIFTNVSKSVVEAVPELLYTTAVAPPLALKSTSTLFVDEFKYA